MDCKLQNSINTVWVQNTAHVILNCRTLTFKKMCTQEDDGVLFHAQCVRMATFWVQHNTCKFADNLKGSTMHAVLVSGDFRGGHTWLDCGESG